MLDHGVGVFGIELAVSQLPRCVPHRRPEDWIDQHALYAERRVEFEMNPNAPLLPGFRLPLAALFGDEPAPPA